jgi:hypothetical protein
MAVKSVFRRFFKILLIVIGIHAIVILGLHIWFVNNARGVLREIVSEKSGGKLKLRLSKLSFDFFSNELQIREASLESTDTVSQPATYHVRFRKLTLRINSFWPLIFQKRLLLDSIKLHDPVIGVLLWRKDTTLRVAKDDLSLPQEMGKLYNSMLDVLDGFGIRRIIINNATLSLVNKMKPDSKPVIISNVYLEVLRTTNQRFKRENFAEHEQMVDLTTTNQNIALPGGRHQLAFKTFRLHLFRRHIELDSCTITATPTDRFKSSYKIFFSKLLLIGVDFNAMYRDNLIRADSVYCENPLFDINLIPSTLITKKKERPDAEKIVRELTGDLDLAFVGVKDAGIHININGSKPRSLFNSNKDNFEMRGLRINADSSEPVTVQQFDMLVRDYRLYNEDSSTAYSFDSVTFKNNKIVLNNFSVTTTSGRLTPRSYRDYRIPYFELTGLDWYQLVFDETLKAREAVLFNPVINYTKNERSVRAKKMKLFESLQNIDNLVTLDKINIIHGQINMKLGPSTSFNFENVNLSLYSDKLLKSTNKEGLRKAVDHFSFMNGLLKIKDITAKLYNVRYTDSNLIHADKLSIRSTTREVTAEVNDVYIYNMIMDDDMETIVVDGLRWKNAVLALSPVPAKKNNRATNIEFKNISGNNTHLTFKTDKSTITSMVRSLRINSLSKIHNQPLHIQGFFLDGNDLSVNSETLQLKANAYQFAEGSSFISQLSIERNKENDSINVRSPLVQFSADINEILTGDIHVRNVEAKSLDIDIKKWQQDVTPISEDTSRPSIRIDHVTASEPAVQVATHRNDSVTIINIPRTEKGLIKASDITVSNEGVRLGTLSFNTNAATLIKASGEEMGVEKGAVEMELSSVHFSKRDGKPFWSGLINKLYLQNPRHMQIGRNNSKLLLNEMSMGNLQLSSDYMSDFNQLIKYNVSAWLRSASGEYIDSTTTLKWHNAGYDNKSKTLSLDSFSYFPTQSRDSVMANTPYQTDYITFRTGAIKITDFNIDNYKTDTAFIANMVHIKNPVITIYRDKKPPFRGGIIKPLPVNSIRRISVPVLLSQVNIEDGKLSYIERNAESRAEAVVYLTNINGGLSNIKNRNLGAEDSLGLSLNAYLLDSAFLDLRVKQSYADSLSGFLMTLRMKPTSLSFLNPVLTPLSNVIITSGSVDSLHLRAIGKEHIALGEMNMYYHDLRIRMVKPGSPDKTTFKTRLISSIANKFIIKKNNKGRTGLVYFERLRDRSFFNYIVKMTFSGLATSVGFKKNRKYKKQYEQELQNRKLPPIDL